MSGVFKDFAWLEGLRVHINHMGRGIGRFLISKAMEISRSKVIRLLIRKDNKPSLALATSLSFRQIDKIYYHEGTSKSFSEILKLSQARVGALICRSFKESWLRLYCCILKLQRNSRHVGCAMRVRCLLYCLLLEISVTFRAPQPLLRLKENKRDPTVWIYGQMDMVSKRVLPRLSFYLRFG